MALDTALDPMTPWGNGRRYLNFLAGTDTTDATAECFEAEALASSPTPTSVVERPL
ncbi:hypothetical protein [Amycolatopsis taiwanensis]|uniref:Uncharacterized protein n=1 Tax=Amycolatopsis taiwanensis TaxID=342230 RepID=A0A9W6VHX0_9PSEU|nr:hypothetical protein [Amycolatopsis taiwanensis]GLY67837.1 hypothetical protein Atai01_44560 [Amycolatopsis taiwanensis]